ncbi:MAG TPA: FAD-dependent thymidylate synthase [Desulfitobacteriaceae bacterium]|nr:FAD-dependent thymidylate synthase [Desulfitobacteriaceae bacterium]
MKKKYVGEGKVVLIAGGGKIYTDIAARFIRSERSLEEIIATPYSRELVRKIITSGHKAAVEFDFFVFGIEGYSRVTEVQLVRKRIASYMIKTGRADKAGKRSFEMVIPRSIEATKYKYPLPVDLVVLEDGTPLAEYLPPEKTALYYTIDADCVMSMIEGWYQKGIEDGLPEEELRYLKPQATEFKALIGMNAHALTDWFAIRCCRNAQTEIRDLANKMLAICKKAAPDLFEDAGPSCRVLGYCPENELQNENCRGKIIPKKQALEILGKAGRP